MSPLYPCPVYVIPCLRGQCRLLHSSPWNCMFFNAFNYIHTTALHIHTQGTFTNHTEHSLYRILVTAASVMAVVKMGNTVPRVGIKPTSLAFWASVKPLHHIGSLISPLYPRLPVYVAPCLRGECRLLQYLIKLLLTT